MFSFCGEVHRVPAKHNPALTYDCDLCDSGDWLSETEVEIHKHTAHKDHIRKVVKRARGPVCFTCAKRFSSKDTLLVHIKTVHLLSSSTARRVEREIFVCEYCRDIFFKKEMLACHMVHKHGKKVTLRCPICPAKLRPKQVYAHLSTRHQLQSVSCCPLCLCKTANRKELAEHISTHNKHYNCDVCGFVTNKERDFSHHLQIYSKRWNDCLAKDIHKLKYQGYFIKPQLMKKWSPNTNRFGLKGLRIWNSLSICILCREICSDDAQMVEHIATTHAYSVEEKPKIYMCECGESYNTVIMLKHHVFKMKGEHRMLKAKKEEPVETIAPQQQESNDEVTQDDLITTEDLSIPETHKTGDEDNDNTEVRFEIVVGDIGDSSMPTTGEEV